MHLTAMISHNFCVKMQEDSRPISDSLAQLATRQILPASCPDIDCGTYVEIQFVEHSARNSV